MKFVPHFSDIAEPMRKLLKLDTTWQWESQQGKAFDRLKQKISSNRVLAQFDTQFRTIVSTDASAVALGSVLSQIQNGEERPIAFSSRTLSPAERAYSVGEREALACIWALLPLRS